MRVYRIKADSGWYGHGSRFGADEDLSPLFTNEARARKKIRDERRIARNWVSRGETHWLESLSQWETAEVVTYDLVRHP